MLKTVSHGFQPDDSAQSRILLLVIGLVVWIADISDPADFFVSIQPAVAAEESESTEESPDTPKDDGSSPPASVPADPGLEIPEQSDLLPQIQSGEKRPTFLMTGDAFSVQCVISRTSRMQVADGNETTKQVTDRLHFDYRVDAVSSTGELTVHVQVRDCYREIRRTETESGNPADASVPDHRIAPLQNLEITLQVSPDGTVRDLRTRDRDQILATLAGGRAAASGFLSDANVDEVIRTTVGRPFWITADFLRSQSVEIRKDSAKSPFPRSDHISLGALGHFRVDVQGRQVGARDQRPSVGPASEDAPTPASSDASVAPRGTDSHSEDEQPGTVIFDLTGTGNYVPPISGRRILASLPVQLLSPEVTLLEYTGKTLAWKEQSDEEISDAGRQGGQTSRESAPTPDPLRSLVRPGNRQPPFFQLLLSHRLTGTAQVSIRSEVTPVRFSQEQAQSWSLMRWRPAETGLMNPLFRRRVR